MCRAKICIFVVVGWYGFFCIRPSGSKHLCFTMYHSMAKCGILFLSCLSIWSIALLFRNKRFMLDEMTLNIFSIMNELVYVDIGRIHLIDLRIHKYFMDDSSVNFHYYKFFLHFLLKFTKK